MMTQDTSLVVVRCSRKTHENRLPELGSDMESGKDTKIENSIVHTILSGNVGLATTTIDKRKNIKKRVDKEGGPRGDEIFANIFDWLLTQFMKSTWIQWIISTLKNCCCSINEMSIIIEMH